MDYRTLPRGGEKISVLGIGSSSIQAASEKEIEETVRTAVQNGINYFDMASSEAKPFPAYGRALADCRRQVYFQIHFGANYETGTYGWTTNLDTVKRSVEWQLKSLQTDYIDFGFIHCIDGETDLHKIEKAGVIRYIEELKAQNVVRHIGLSSHAPALVNRVLDMKIIDMLMFSINPAYDYAGSDDTDYSEEYAIGGVAERMDMYRRCETEGVGISVMKPFSGGQLLNAKTSPFGKALTEFQCIQYALDKPAVLTVLAGIRGMADLQRILGFCNAAKEEKDYSIIGTFAPRDAEGNCVYCNHCAPCPADLNVGLINKYYDLSKAGDILAGDHYKKLEIKADKCTKCGHCGKRCPFRVDQPARMGEINAYFGG
ncbi:MAG: aldo/keto reductase [Ruminococcus sp.]|nr:aldo/keto reductase [Ruminococcus sp.]MCM1382523.1 aldo/keto reductase [Muribaculaceae bacterium]MCM1480256.1 aldo/keto reductase [Muribaculaceae bacterium]